MRSLLGRAKRAFAARREAWPWFDHLIRAGARYQADGGNRLSAALTMYAIFALLPLLLVAMSLLGYLMANNPERQAEVFSKISSVLPGVGAQLGKTLSTVKTNRAATGAFGLLGLALSGLGGVDALRDALRLMWHQDTAAGNFFRKKLSDLMTVGVVGVTLVVSFAVTALATGGAGALLDGVGITGTLSHVVLAVLTFFVGVLVDAALFLVLFKWLPRVDWPLRRLVRGAVFGGFAFGVLKIAGTWYVARAATRSTALYGSIGTGVGVLVGLYLVSRVILYTAAWTVTAPGWDDVEPSGTASPEAAREAGLPESAARPAHERRSGRRTARPADPPSRGSHGDRAPLPVGAAATKAAYTGPSEQARERTVVAARAIQGFAATLIAAVGVYGLRTLRRS